MDEDNQDQEFDESEDQGDELPDDPAALKALVAELKQKQSEAEGKTKAANDNAKNLRLKKKGIEQEVAELREFKRQQEEKAAQAKLAEMSEAEKLKVLLDSSDGKAKTALTEAQKARQEANSAKLDLELVKAGVDDKKLQYIKPFLLGKMSEDELSLDEALSELKTELPSVFKAKEKKVVEKPANSGLPAGKKKEPETPSGAPDTKVASRSTSIEDRKKHQQLVRDKYKIQI